LGYEMSNTVLSMFAGTFSAKAEYGYGVLGDRYVTLSNESSDGQDWYTVHG